MDYRIKIDYEMYDVEREHYRKNQKCNFDSTRKTFYSFGQDIFRINIPKIGIGPIKAGFFNHIFVR